MRGIAPVKLNKSRLQLCNTCRERTLPAGSDMPHSCQGCSKNSVFCQLRYCSQCAKLRNCCQICTGSMAEGKEDAVAAPSAPGKNRTLKTISILDFLKREAQANSLEWEEYLPEFAGTVTDGASAPDKRQEAATIRISRSPCIDPEERRQINGILSDYGLDATKRDLAIGTLYRLTREDLKSQGK